MPRPVAVLDTNVIVSAHLNPAGHERLVLELGLSRKFQIVISNDIFEEYSAVLRREHFGLRPELVGKSLAAIWKAARKVKPSRRVRAAHHAEDNILLECAREAVANYVVTGNKRHFPNRFGVTRIVNAREFLEAVIPELSR